MALVAALIEAKVVYLTRYDQIFYVFFRQPSESCTHLFPAILPSAPIFWRVAQMRQFTFPILMARVAYEIVTHLTIFPPSSQKMETFSVEIFNLLVSPSEASGYFRISTRLIATFAVKVSQNLSIFKGLCHCQQISMLLRIANDIQLRSGSLFFCSIIKSESAPNFL